MKNQKPYFSKEQVARILDVFTTQMTIDGYHYDDQMVAAVAKYIQSSKSAYENCVLSHVFDGKYVLAVVNKQIAYKVAPLPKDVTPTPTETASIRKAAADLTHSMNMITLYGKTQKLEI